MIPIHYKSVVKKPLPYYDALDKVEDFQLLSKKKQIVYVNMCKMTPISDMHTCKINIISMGEFGV